MSTPSSPNLINEATVGQNRAHQQNKPTNIGLRQQPASAQIERADVNAAHHLPGLGEYPESSAEHQFRPAFRLHRAVRPDRSFPTFPSFGFDSRWPFDGTDNLATFTDNITWIKGSHSIKTGFYFEHDARNVSVYSVYNTAGTYYFGSDLGNPVDTGDPFSNALTGNIYGYGQDNLKQQNRARYKQTEFFVQDTWKVMRRLTLDYGARFSRLGALYEANEPAARNLPGIRVQPEPRRAAPVPHLHGRRSLHRQLPRREQGSINPGTGAIYPYSQQGTFDPASYCSSIRSRESSTTNQLLQDAAACRSGRASALPMTYSGMARPRSAAASASCTAARSASTRSAPRARASDRSPLRRISWRHWCSNTTIANLQGSPLVFTPPTTVGGPLSYPPPSTYNFSTGIQQDLGRGFVMDIAFVGNVAHHQFNQGTGSTY